MIQVRLPRKALFAILLPCALIVLAASLEVLASVKDLSLYESWRASMLSARPAETAEILTFDNFASLQLMLYFTKLVIPCALGLFTYWTWLKSRVNYLFVFVWTVLTAGSLGYFALGPGAIAVFTYIYLTAHLVLLIAILSLTGTIRAAANN